MGKKFISEFLPNLTTEGLASVKTDLEIITDEERAKLTAATAPIELLNATERKTLTSYDPDGVVVGVTRVIQTDESNVVYYLIAADVTLDASWRKYIDAPSDEDFVINMELADFAGIVPDANVFGQVGGVPSIGNGVDTGGNRVSMLPKKPDGMIRLSSNKESDIIIKLKHDGVGGALGVVWSKLYVSGFVSMPSGLPSNISFPHDYGIENDIYIWSATDLTSGKVGDIREISSAGEGLLSIDLKGLLILEDLTVSDNELRDLNLNNLASLETCFCSNNKLPSLDLSGLSLLTRLDCNSNPLLTSLLATGVELSYNQYGTSGSDISNCALTTEALVVFLESLSTTTTGLIKYGGNVGSTAFETYLATADDKGYIWLNA